MLRQELMTRYSGLAKALAWKIHRKLPRHVEVDELIGYGLLGLAEAARAFNPDLGHKFSTFAYYRIRGAIFDGLQQMDWFRLADYHASAYEETEPGQSDGQSEHNTPSASNSPQRQPRAKRRSAVLSLAQLEMQQGDAVPDPGAGSPEDSLHQREMEEKLLSAINTLPAATQALIRWTYFDGLTLKEAGERLGHTKSWASRLHASALRKLALAMGGG